MAWGRSIPRPGDSLARGWLVVQRHLLDFVFTSPVISYVVGGGEEAIAL